jgi:hypothetical protein
VDTPDYLTGDSVLLTGWGFDVISSSELIEHANGLKFISLKASKKCDEMSGCTRYSAEYFLGKFESSIYGQINTY